MYKIRTSERTLHFRQPAGTSRGVYTERRIWLVSITDGSHTGVGECAPLPDLSCDALPPLIYNNVLRKYCDVVELTGEIPFEELRPYPSMLFGLETAMLSLKAAESGSHVAGLLYDTPFSRGEEGIPINGLVWMGTFDEMRQRIDQKLEQGFRCIKLKIGAIDFEKELELISMIRSRYSHRELELRVDANGAFGPLPAHPSQEGVGNALYKLELLSQYALHSIEQPIKAGQWAYMAELCRDAPLPIALDEELIGINDRDQKRQMLHIVKPAYIVLKPSLHGGISGCEEWMEAAREEGVGSWITSALESNIGLNAIAQFCSHAYGSRIDMPQGLGTGQLFTDNIDMPLSIRGQEIWVTKG